MSEAALPALPAPGEQAAPLGDRHGPRVLDGNEIGGSLIPVEVPSSPKSFFFWGFGWGNGVGCAVGPFLGIGVGMAIPTGVVFGAGAGVGAVCGAGFGGGFNFGNGLAYIPFGANNAVYYSPKFEQVERLTESLRMRGMNSRRRRRSRTWEIWPQPIKRAVSSLMTRMGLVPPDFEKVKQRQKSREAQAGGSEE